MLPFSPPTGVPKRVRLRYAVFSLRKSCTKTQGRQLIESLGQQLYPKGVNVRKHANRDLIDPLLSESARYIENEADGNRTGVNEP